MRHNYRARAFTLIELLVVIALIAVLISLLFPVMGAITRNARAAICASNERQMLGALTEYTANNNGYMPLPLTAWSGTNGYADFVTGPIWAYLGNSVQTRTAVIRCPADTLEQYCTYGGVDVIPPPFRNFSYSLNRNTSNSLFTCGIPLAQVRNPAGHVWVYEEFAPNDSVNYGPTDIDDWLTGRHGGPGTIEHRSTYNNSNWRFDGRGNVGYFDGHVALMSVDGYFSTNYHWGPLSQ